MNRFLIISYSLIFLVLAGCDQGEKITVTGLEQEVEVFRDEQGINHIFAQNEHDLFFAQGYLAAKDRLFQFEIWRRQATGTLAEILGERELERDRGARLFKFRGDKKSELSHYHPNGEAIVDAFVAGINTYIAEANTNPELLPIEFQMLGIQPEPWTWEVVISRHQGLLQNVQDELRYSRIVSQIGPDKTRQLLNFHPNQPVLDLDPSIPEELLFKDILAPYNAFRRGVSFLPEDVSEKFRMIEQDKETIAQIEADLKYNLESDAFAQGSNNWILSGEKTESGYPYMANDPHRLQAIPSLRYWVHLNAPGWNVIGGGEPVIPGVSIGHNEHGAWGLTIFETDNEDLRIYDLHPENPLLYQYQGEWLEMETIQDTIQVRGKADQYVTHRYTRHGPVTFVDEELRKVVAVECAWLEIGSAPYLASLRMDQSKTWEEFREACTYNNIPAENMIWAGRAGNIGWQATGISPIRKGFSGLIATKGDGSHEWEGYLPIEDRPSLVNPESGFFATANQNVSPADYAYPEALGYEWADDFRGKRINEVLSQDKKFTLQEMEALQNDYLSIPARKIVPYLAELNLPEGKADSLRRLLLEWDFVLDKNSIPASVYVMWERTLRNWISDEVIPEEAKELISSIQMTKAIEWIEAPSEIFESNPKEMRDTWLKESFLESIQKLEEKLGADISKWQYGQEAYKHVMLRHSLSRAVNEEWRKKLNAGPLPRGGYSFTPGANAYGDNNTSGASFRIIVDTGDWERTRGINNPGQSGDPESRFYKNLFETWAADQYFSTSFARENVEKSSSERQVLKPR